MTDSLLLEIARTRVVVFDGAMGTTVHKLNLPLRDFLDKENCTEAIVLSRPDALLDVHKSFLSVGCDVVMTNTFGANKLVLAEFGLEDQTKEINRRAAEIARAAVTQFQRPKQPRFVAGSIGPGTRLPSLRQTTWDILFDSYSQQVLGLIEGGVDVFIIETCQDPLQAKIAIAAIASRLQAAGVDIPVFCTVTVETTGTMLVGTEISAAWTTFQAFPQVAAFGLNCATGPQEMSEHIRYLARCCDRLLMVQPNAGLPQLVQGKAHYPLTPAELARWLVEFVKVDGVNIVGGCCGTTPEHMAAVVDALADLTPTPRRPTLEPSVSSLYQSTALRQDGAVLAIGERTNANGSKKFRELLAVGDVDGMVAMARDQVRHGSHLLDVCTAYVGRDEIADMNAVLGRFVTDVVAPLVIDSTEVDVLEAALKLSGGKCVINSINLEDGEARLDRVCELARVHGAALIALTIDEEGMAKTADRKVQVAKRIFDRVTRRHRIPATDLIFDPLTFTICTGNEDDRRLACDTLDAISRIKHECPGVSTLLGVSNVSFGVNPAARGVLNSVFLHHAKVAGLDAAILHTSGIVPLYKIDEVQRRIAEDLVFDRRRPGYDPLAELLRSFDQVQAHEAAARPRPADVGERLKLRIIDGDRVGLEEDLDEAMLHRRALDIINDVLLDGMKTVGDLFGTGQMQLPFVLQSAETMKASVRYLEPHLDRLDAGGKGSIILATVSGDVHDIGKNLVDIILTNNGYTVLNLGIKQPIGAMIQAWQEHGADAIGMSGLLVKSTVVMRDNLGVLNERGINVPVILGGAALTRKYVENDLRPRYEGPLFYAKDAFAGLHLMGQIMAAKRSAPASAPASASASALAPARRRQEVAASSTKKEAPADVLIDEPEIRHGYTPPTSDLSRNEPIPQPPFWGSRVIEHIDPRAALAFLNENMLFQVQWDYRKNRRSPEEYQRYVNEEVRPILRDLVAVCERDNVLQPQAIYGFWPALADGDTLNIFDPADRTRVVASFEFPRMGKPPYWCISDFFRRAGGDEFDVAAFSVVTAGSRVSDVARQWFAADRYRDYLHLHGLGVELAEALAEFVHKQIRVEWRIAAADPRDRQDIFKQRYQGSRYSFGYPACPRLEDQLKLWPLLQPQRIGVHLSEEFQLDPEQTTTALIVHHRQAKYFNVR